MLCSFLCIELCFLSLFSESESFSPFLHFYDLNFASLYTIGKAIQVAIICFQSMVVVFLSYFSFYHCTFQWRLSISNQNPHHTMIGMFHHLHTYALTSRIVTIMILESACRFRVSFPDLTRAKALDMAYSRCKESGTHKVLKKQFPGSPNQYSIPQFTEFIFQHRL